MAWWLAYEELYGDMDKTYPIKGVNMSDVNLDDIERSDYWYDYTRNDPNAKNPFTDPKDRERAEIVTGTTPWIYESPDNGKTVYRYERGSDPLKRELIQIEIDQKTYSKASMQLVAAHRMREVTEWSNFKKIYNDGTFDTKNVDTHQLLSYKKIMKNRQNTLTPGSSQPEVFNVLGQMQSIERIEEERKALGHEKKKAISETPKYGKQG